MKKLLTSFTVAIVMILLAVVMLPTFNLTASAEEFTEVTYTFEDEAGSYALTLKDSTNCEFTATSIDGETATVNGTYTIENNVLSLNLLGEYFADFTINGTTLVPIDETTQDGLTDEKIDELIAKLEEKAGSQELTDALQNYLSTYENENVKYFSERILPIIIACAFLLFAGVVCLIPSIKKNKRYTQAIAYIKTLEKQLNDKAEEIKAIKDNAEAVKQAQNEFLSNFAKETSKLALDMNLFSKISASEKENKALLESIKNGMIYICKDDAEAIKIFTQTASEKVVEEDEKKIVNLENEIRKLSSDNAEEIIKNAEQV